MKPYWHTKVALKYLKGQDKPKARQEFLIKSDSSTTLRENMKKVSIFKSNILINFMKSSLLR
jgi:hypothetical protein